MANTGEILTKENSLLDLLKRPNITFDDIAKVSDSTVSAKVGEQIEISVKYQGYIERQNDEIEQMKRLENTLLPLDFDYKSVSGLSNEIVQKIKPNPSDNAWAGKSHQWRHPCGGQSFGDDDKET